MVDDQKAFEPGDTMDGLLAIARKRWPNVSRERLVQVVNELEAEGKIYRQFHTVFDKPTRWRIDPGEKTRRRDS